jgi:hypothetical protein
MTMQLTCMDEEGTDILAENIQKNNFIWKVCPQKEEHIQNIR